MKQFAEAIRASNRPVRVITPLTDRDEKPGAVGTQLSVLHIGRRDDRRPFGSLYGGDGITENIRANPINAMFLPGSMVRMYEALLDEADRASLVIAHWLLPSGLLAAFGRPVHRRPVWIVCHSGGVHALAVLPLPLRLWIGYILARGCDLLSFVTPALRDRFLRLIGRYRRVLHDRCRILPMGTKTTAFDEVEMRPEGPVTMVGRLVPIKGIDRLLWAAAHLASPPPIRIAGDGPENRRLRRLAQRLDLSVEFSGEVTPDQVPQILDGSALAVLPSQRLPTGRTEGLPNFALQALAAGLPLLATACWDMPGSLARLPGVFRVRSSPSAITRGLETALSYARQRGGTDQLQRRRAAAQFDWQCIGAQAVDWIDRLARREEFAPFDGADPFEEAASIERFPSYS